MACHRQTRPAFGARHEHRRYQAFAAEDRPHPIQVEEKFETIFRVNRERRDEILVYDLFLTKFWEKMAPNCRENAAKI